MQLAPDEILVTMDIEMPRCDGLEATRRIKERFPRVRVLILTAYDDDPYVFALLQAGAHGYVLKTSSADELARSTVPKSPTTQMSLSPVSSFSTKPQIPPRRP